MLRRASIADAVQVEETRGRWRFISSNRFVHIDPDDGPELEETCAPRLLVALLGFPEAVMNVRSIAATLDLH